MDSGGTRTPPGDTAERAPVYSIFQGLKRTPTRKKASCTPSKRVHSPEEELKSKREKLLKPTDQTGKNPVEQASPNVSSFPVEPASSLPTQTEMEHTSNPASERFENRQETSQPFQELDSILESLAKLAQDRKSSTMLKLITAARAIVNAHKDRKTVDTGTETEFKEIRKLRWKDRIEGGTPRDQWAALCEEHWPPEAYLRTAIVGPHPINQPGTTSLILCRRNQIMGPEGELLRQSIPALSRMNHETIPEIVRISSTESIEGMESLNSSVFLMSLAPEADTEAIFSAFEDLRSRIEGFNDNIIVTTLTAEGAVVRKAIELVFTGTGVKWSLTTRRTNPKKNPTETLVVSPGDMTYAQLLKSCKENVVAEELGVRVLNVRQNNTGCMEMRVSGKVKALRDKIQERVPGVIMTEKRRMTTMHIKDLEEEVTKEEIVTGLKRVLKDQVLQPLVTSIRPAYDNTCRATVKIEKEAAEILSKKGFIQVGLISARIWIREERARCHKCKEEGHLKADCRGEYKPNACFTCKEVGHFKVNCPTLHRKND